jgi:hypothetical protein
MEVERPVTGVRLPARPWLTVVASSPFILVCLLVQPLVAQDVPCEQLTHPQQDDCIAARKHGTLWFDTEATRDEYEALPKNTQLLLLSRGLANREWIRADELHTMLAKLKAEDEEKAAQDRAKAARACFTWKKARSRILRLAASPLSRP